MDPSPNPYGCCGAKTSCCSGIEIPDSLSVAIETDCGVFDVPLGRVDDNDLGPEWNGDGDIQCKNLGDCETQTVNIGLVCADGSFLMSVPGAPPDLISENCDSTEDFTLVFEGDFADCVGEVGQIKLTVTGA